MAEHSSIEWTDATWNVVTGCQVVSPGCTNCYAMRLAGTRLKHHPSRAGLTTLSKAGPVWNGQVRFNAGWLAQPLAWKRPRKVFVCAHGDLFADGVEDAWLDQIFAVMALSPQHTFQVLTKRPQRMREYLTGGGFDFLQRIAAATLALGRVAQFSFPLPNVWLGVSAEDQVRADERIPELLATPAANRFVSIEPLLGPVDLRFWVADATREGLARHLDWVILGGESGPGARPMHPDWARQIRDACAAAGVPFFFKQWGEYAPSHLGEANVIQAGGQRASTAWPDGSIAHGSAEDHGGYGTALHAFGKAVSGRLLDGVEHNAMPEPA